MTDIKEKKKVEYSIEIKDLKIIYRTLQKTSIRQNIFKFQKNSMDKFEALRGVSFKVQKGQVLGVVGKNGSGKSTLLKAMAGVFAPDEGTIDMKGYSVSLLSIGVGFQRKLTGRENIYLSGMLLGFDEAFIKNKEDEIIEFSELGDFIDKPVKTYSSGMYSKLAFSITAVLETEIMLVDEVLSVGDKKFREKSYRKMRELISDDDRTVVIVSHSTDTLQELCDKILWIHDGVVKEYGEKDIVLPHYNEFMS
ncbi:MAG: ABC transporter ATP-binding protein [Lachnospiraceae bacterium]|jgi:ABC-type polysaccharide/polyol phosphate transport system ATPase subunit|nr:ABC transporter ATP-binding protein [Lachnospiraceae bacterium]